MGVHLSVMHYKVDVMVWLELFVLRPEAIKLYNTMIELILVI